jgi:hypothetical protein
MEVGEHSAAIVPLDHEGGATGFRSPITTFPHGIWSPSAVNRMPYGPSSCSLRSRTAAASISALAAATVSAATSVRMVASISARTDSVSGS